MKAVRRRSQQLLLQHMLRGVGQGKIGPDALQAAQVFMPQAGSLVHDIPDSDPAFSGVRILPEGGEKMRYRLIHTGNISFVTSNTYQQRHNAFGKRLAVEQGGGVLSIKIMLI